MTRRRTVAIATTSAVLAIGLLGGGALAVAGSMNDSFHIAGGTPVKGAPTAAPTPVDEEEAAKVAAAKAASGLAIGATLTADQAQAISHYWQGPQMAYKLVDGTQVLIARDQPLPENVKVDAGKVLAGTADAAAAAGDNSGAALEQKKKDLEYSLGHHVSIVVYAYLALAPAFESFGRAWISNEFGGGQQYSSAEEALAAVRAKVGPTAEIIMGR